MLTIKSGKKGPQIKKGIIEAIIKLIIIEFGYLKLFISFFKFKNYLVLILTTLFSLLLIILDDFKSILEIDCSS